MSSSKIRKAVGFILFGILMVFYFALVGLIVLHMYLTALVFGESRYIHKYCKRAWIHVTMFTLYVYFYKPIYVYYNPLILQKERNIIISNHITEYDWIAILTILYKYNRFDNVCIILKRSLRDIPLLGYGMYRFGFIFLNRKLKNDEGVLEEGLDKLRMRKKYDLLIFPEGTYNDKIGTQVSDEYVRNNPIVIDGENFTPSEVLLPHVTGFNKCRSALYDCLDGVVDITMMINPYVPHPQDIHTYEKTLTVFSDKIAFAMVIDYKRESGDKDFIYKQFKRKDEIIKKYKQEQCAITNMESFKTCIRNIYGESDGCVYDSVHIWSFYGLLIYIITFAGIAFMIAKVTK